MHYFCCPQISDLKQVKQFRSYGPCNLSHKVSSEAEFLSVSGNHRGDSSREEWLSSQHHVWWNMPGQQSLIPSGCEAACYSRAGS